MYVNSLKRVTFSRLPSTLDIVILLPGSIKNTFTTGALVDDIKEVGLEVNVC
jgi:hypothetical protein